MKQKKKENKKNQKNKREAKETKAIERKKKKTKTESKKNEIKKENKEISKVMIQKVIKKEEITTKQINLLQNSEHQFQHTQHHTGATLQDQAEERNERNNQNNKLIFSVKFNLNQSNKQNKKIHYNSIPKAPIDINWDYNMKIENVNDDTTLFHNDICIYLSDSNPEKKMENFDVDNFNSFLDTPEDL
eukprot:TRINITY_DN6551_c0_g1_i1.p1 TRINITY_DN6551_c0_g1~~TRINITY_DN6551_c0_g1_i1.p1  ORF type:complete len:188 (+),score=73.66 TRINITY_DN6551_c0_g1_i1:341-904(+)